MSVGFGGKLKTINQNSVKMILSVRQLQQSATVAHAEKFKHLKLPHFLKFVKSHTVFVLEYSQSVKTGSFRVCICDGVKLARPGYSPV